MAETQDVTTEENIPVASNPSVSYIGEEELKYFLSLVNRLGDLKYMPIDKVIDKAQSAIEANRLSQTVLINGQDFDGTQNISFDEYAKAADVLNKTDCAIAGAEDNSNKVVTLNDKGKVNGDFIDYEHIVKQINEAPFGEIESKIQNFEEQYQKDFQSLAATEKNQDADIATIKSYIGMRQAKTAISKNNLPASITLKDVEFENFCTAPIEVLKDISLQKTANLDYVKLGYNGQKEFSNCTVSANKISVTPQPISTPLLIKDDVATVNSDAMNASDNLISPEEIDIDGTKYYVTITRAFELANLSEYAELLLPQLETGYCYGLFLNDKDIYHIKDGSLVKCYTMSETPDDDSDDEVDMDFISAVKSIMTGESNKPILMSMIQALKSGTARLIVVTKDLKDIQTSKMAISDYPKDGYAIEADFSMDFIAKEIRNIQPHYTCKQSTIRFGLKMKSKNGSDYSYAVWDKKNNIWQPVQDKKEIATKGTLINELSSFTLEALNIADMDFSFVFVFLPEALDSVCTLDEIEMSYVDASCYEKAIHSTDYTCTYGKRSITIKLLNEGNYLINYPVSDVLPLYSRKIETLTPDK